MSEKKKKKKGKKKKDREVEDNGLRELSPEELGLEEESAGIPEYTAGQAMADVRTMYHNVMYNIISSTDPGQEGYSLQDEIKDTKRVIGMSTIVFAYWAEKLTSAILSSGKKETTIER